jgi:hypothetical protein
MSPDGGTILKPLDRGIAKGDPHDGPGLYRELEQPYPHLLSHMIFLTGNVLSPEARDFFEQVDCLRLIKPFRAREVRQLIQQMLAAQ